MVCTLEVGNLLLDKTYKAFPAFLFKYKYLNEICDFL